MKRKLPKLNLRASIDNSVNDEDRTVELTWTTGAKGLRSHWGEKYYEELSLDPTHVDMSRLAEGAPLLAAHDSSSLDSVVGVVERAWLEKDAGKAIVRFATDDFSERVFRKVKERVLRNVSVGYTVDEYTNVSNQGDEVPTYRATRWQPAEISIVPIGFDSGARTRNQDQQLIENEVEILGTRSEETQSSKGEEMPPENKAAEAPQIDAEALKQEAAKQERERTTGIMNAVRENGLPEKFAQEMIERGLPLVEAKTNIEMLARYYKESPPVSNTVSVQVGETDQEKKRAALEDALLSRVDRHNFKPTERSQTFLGKSLLRAFEDLIGRKVGESDAQLAKRAMSSSDLPLILANVAEKAAQKRYQLAPRTWEKWAKKSSLRNYKEAQQLRIGDFASLEERKEGGEYKLGSFGEEKEVVQLKDYGKKMAFTSQMLVNDDLSMISLVTSEGGVAAARLENRRAYLALTTNKTMGDGVTLYHADHGNLSTASAINSASFSDAFKKMRKQTSVDGLDRLNLTPRFLVCGPDKEAEARQFLAQIVPNQTSSVNIYVGAVELIVDAEISANEHYFLADPNLVDTVTLFHLEGKESPQIESRLNWDNESVELKVGHTVAAEPMDYRGIVKNPGA